MTEPGKIWGGPKASPLLYFILHGASGKNAFPGRAGGTGPQPCFSATPTKA